MTRSWFSLFLRNFWFSFSPLYWKQNQGNSLACHDKGNKNITLPTVKFVWRKKKLFREIFIEGIRKFNFIILLQKIFSILNSFFWNFSHHFCCTLYSLDISFKFRFSWSSFWCQKLTTAFFLREKCWKWSFLNSCLSLLCHIYWIYLWKIHFSAQEN